MPSDEVSCIRMEVTAIRTDRIGVVVSVRMSFVPRDGPTRLSGRGPALSSDAGDDVRVGVHLLQDEEEEECWWRLGEGTSQQTQNGQTYCCCGYVPEVMLIVT